jgi:sulfate/thiosulfate transport system permease protein
LTARFARYGLRFAAVGYVAALIGLPIGLIFYRTFQHGLGTAWHAVTTPGAKHALLLTLEIAAIAVPANTIFGVALALVLVRHRFRGSGFVNALVDVPLAVSPVVVGISLYLLYGTGGWFSGLAHHGVRVLFSPPGMVLASMFVSLPFVVREVVPVLREIGTEQEQAAATLGASALATFRRVTLPSIRWAVAYGVVLTTARVLGEYGAVKAVSGSIEGRTQTLPLYVEQQYTGFDLTGAYAASAVLALIALSTLLLTSLFKRKEHA